MACKVGDPFRLEANGTTPFTANERNRDLCTATKILDRLHREFTEQYVEAPQVGGQVATGKTAITATEVKANPTFYLRKQPTLADFPTDTVPITGTTFQASKEIGGSTVNRLYNILNSTRTGDNSQAYRTAVHAITYGVYNASIASGGYLNPPDSSEPTFATPSNFKGIYGLKKLNDALESQTITTVNAMTGTEQAPASINTNIDNATKYTGRQGLKTTLEEIARRENEIYREKFLHIMLVVVGIFLVSSQLVRKYLSFGGGGGTSGGFGFGSGNLFTGFGLGSGSGLFSRFGGLGLGRSGRSRITSMFSNNPYSLSNR
jgi:hypothetical protein